MNYAAVQIRGFLCGFLFYQGMCSHPREAPVELVGHRTESVYRRYDIVSEEPFSRFAAAVCAGSRYRASPLRASGASASRSDARMAGRRYQFGVAMRAAVKDGSRPGPRSAPHATSMCGAQSVA